MALPRPRNTTPHSADADVATLHVERLREELVVLRNAIRAHRDERGHDRCWLDDDRLYGYLPEAIGADAELPPLPEFLENCQRFWASRQQGRCSKKL